MKRVCLLARRWRVSTSWHQLDQYCLAQLCDISVSKTEIAACIPSGFHETVSNNGQSPDSELLSMLNAIKMPMKPQVKFEPSPLSRPGSTEMKCVVSKVF